jgi:hypothetical protein
MENPRGSTTIIERAFSTKKRLFGFLLAATLILAVPITISLLSQRQDIRQRASETSVSPTPPQSPSESPFDLNNDGRTDELDLNILYYGFTNREGD